MSMNIRHLINANRAYFTSIIQSKRIPRLVHTAPYLRYYSADKSTEDTKEDAPIRYSTSRAGAWTARQSRVGTRTEEDIPWFQPYAITFSLAIFLLYFCVLREENDIDEELGVSLYDRISGLEKKQLELSLQYNLDHSKDTKDIKKRLEEIEKEEQKN